MAAAGSRRPRMDPGRGPEAPCLRKAARLAALVSAAAMLMNSDEWWLRAGPAFAGVSRRPPSQAMGGPQATAETSISGHRDLLSPRGTSRGDRPWAITMHHANKDRSKRYPIGLLYLRNSASKGFSVQGASHPQRDRLITVEKPTLKRQRYNFIDMNVAGYSVSEVFLRFPGATNWKRVGELTSKTGDFSEAVRCQWLLIIQHAARLHPKTRVWLPTDVPLELGYADENAEIVSVKDPLPEGVMPLTLRAMLNRCGFVGDQKEWTYRGIKEKMNSKIESKKQWHIFRPYLLYRKLTNKPEWGQPMYLRAKYRWKGRYSHWFGGMKGWAVKSHFQRVASSHGPLYPFGKTWPRRKR